MNKAQIIEKLSKDVEGINKKQAEKMIIKINIKLKKISFGKKEFKFYF